MSTIALTLSACNCGGTPSTPTAVTLNTDTSRGSANQALTSSTNSTGFINFIGAIYLTSETNVANPAKAMAWSPDGKYFYTAVESGINRYESNILVGHEDISVREQGTPRGIATTTNSKGQQYIYCSKVDNNGNSYLMEFRINSDGTFDPASRETVNNNGALRQIAVSSTNNPKYLFATTESGIVLSYFVNDTTGMLYPAGMIKPQSTGEQAYGITVSPDGNHVYTAIKGNGYQGINIYNINSDGSLTWSSLKKDSDTIVSVVITSDGKSLFAGTLNGWIDNYSIGSDGSLTMVNHQHIGNGETNEPGIIALAITPNNKYPRLYAERYGEEGGGTWGTVRMNDIDYFSF